MKPEDILGQIIIVAFMIVCVGFPLYVIVQSIINLVRASDGRGAIVLKALVVLGVWAVLTMIVVFIPFMFVFEPISSNRVTADRFMNVLAIVLTLIYIAVALALGYWVRLQPGWKTLLKGQD